MPKTTRLFTKASVLYLCLGSLLGALLLFHRWLPLGSWVPALKASHVSFLLQGWLTQLILGVAWWLLPPLHIGLRPDAPLPVRRGQTQRGSEPLFWATFVLLNAGILLRGLCEPLQTWTGSPLFGAMVASSEPLLLLAAAGFVANTWSRVRELGRPRS
jgi:hypothetical protein